MRTGKHGPPAVAGLTALNVFLYLTLSAPLARAITAAAAVFSGLMFFAVVVTDI